MNRQKADQRLNSPLAAALPSKPGQMLHLRINLAQNRLKFSKCGDSILNNYRVAAVTQHAVSVSATAKASE